MDDAERFATIDARSKENERQVQAAWVKIDELRTAIETMKISAVEMNATTQEKIANLKELAMVESFGMKTRIAEIAWRVGLLVAGALLIINFLFTKTNVFSIFTDTKVAHQDGRKR